MAVRVLCASLILAGSIATGAAGDDAWLTWQPSAAREIGRSTRVSGRVGSIWGFRGLHTERAQNYELRATWLTPDVLRASARFAQLRDHRSANDTRALVEAAEAMADTIVLVELDPREGSGVIPLDWTAFLRPQRDPPDDSRASPGVLLPQGRENAALGGVERRDYDYDQFWVGFPVTASDGRFILEDAVRAELVVRVGGSEGRVTWPVPSSIRARRDHAVSR
jgi:hypothetical protein